MHVFLQLTTEKKVDRRLLPPKKMLGKNSKSLVERRQKELELYLQTLLQQFPQATPTPLACFLHFHLYVSTPEIVTIYNLRIRALIWYFGHSGMFLSMCVDAAARCGMWFQSWGQGSVQDLSQQIRKTIFLQSLLWAWVQWPVETGKGLFSNCWHNNLFRACLLTLALLYPCVPFCYCFWWFTARILLILCCVPINIF